MSFLTNPTLEEGVELYVAYQVVSALVQSLPTPAEITSVWYKAFYNFCTIVVGDFKSFVKVPTFAKTTSSSAVTTVLPSGSIETVNTDVTATSTSGTNTKSNIGA